MTTENPFVLSLDKYVRQLDPIGQAMEQYAVFLHKMTGKSMSECKAGVAKIIKERKHPTIRNPEVDFFFRGDNGDRNKETTTLHEYIYTSIKDRDIIAPTLTTYFAADIKESLFAPYVDGNVALRNVAKKEMFKARAAGDKDMDVYHNRDQNNHKTKNNSLSGAQVSTSTPISNKTAHSTLTSNCRSTSGYGNANNEKFLSGNRHYYSYDIVFNNITSIITTAEYDRLDKTLRDFNMHVPTVDDVMECITYSTQLYWRNSLALRSIRSYVEKLDGLQRAAFVYYGDFHHIKKHNEELSRDFIGSLSTKVEGQHLENAEDYLHSSDEARVDLARSICRIEMVGVKKDKASYKAISHEPRFQTLVCTLKNINETIDRYADFIRTFWVTPSVPASVAYFPKSVRRSALTSDTDSTIFTVQDWVKWYYKKPRNKAGSSVADVMPFLAGQVIVHVLAKMSANFGVEPKRMFEIAMKSEYKFDVFIPTNVAKHYYATKNIQEGIILNPIDYEIKGVHLKNSNIPKSIVTDAQDMMKKILTISASGETIKIREFLKHVADTERELMKDIMSGKLLRTIELKTASSYTKSAEQSPYQYHTLWNEVFAPTYGQYTEPPYAATRITTTLDNPTKYMSWIDSMDNKELSHRMRVWSSNNGKKTLPSLLIPTELVRTNGIPVELIQAMNVRKTVSDLCNIYYIVLETLGFYLGTTPNAIRLVSDYH